MRAQFTTASVREERDFECAACGHHARAVVVGVGEGSASSLNAPGTAERRAQEAARADIERTLAIAECPACHKRDRGATTRWWLLRTLPVVLTAGLIGFLGWLPMFVDFNMAEDDKSIAGWVMTAIAVVVAIPFFLAHVVFAWSRAKHGVEFGAADRSERAEPD